jgi:predicted nucleotidyltransferase
MLDPSVEQSFAAVARRAGVLPAVAHRELTRLIEADVLRDRRDGNNRLVRANTEHPLWPLMSQLVIETYGPVPILRALLADVSGVKESYLYGSWAARRAGEPGPPPRDLDVLVVGTASRTDLLDVSEAASAKLHIEVSIHRTSTEAWAAMADPFLATVASRPRVQLTGAHAGPQVKDDADDQRQ